MSPERRQSERYQYRCPVWFGTDAGVLRRGMLVDLSCTGLALISSTACSHPPVGQSVFVQFSSPSRDSCLGRPIIRTARVCRVADGGNGPRSIAVQLHQSLSLEPSQLGAIRKESVRPENSPGGNGRGATGPT